MDIKVTIIIPVYNTEAYLDQCLQSVLGQTLQEIEVIAVDDGSKDSSLEILKQYEKQNPNKLRVFHKENGGLSSTRNFALQYANGEYVGFVDSDDWINPEMYEEMYYKAKEENADIVICDIVDHYTDYEIYHHSSRFTNKFMVTASACNKMFRTQFIGDIRFPVGLWYEDLEFTSKQLMKTENISVIHKGFYHCHCRDYSIMNNNNSEKNRDILTVIGHLEAFAKEHGWSDKYADTIEYLYIDHVLITAINRLEKQDSKEKKKVINCLRKAVIKKYPDLYRDQVFQNLPRNRRMIARLNAMGLSTISKLILSVKAKL